MVHISNNNHVLNDTRSSRAQFSSGAKIRVYRSRYSTCSDIAPVASAVVRCDIGRPHKLMKDCIKARKSECRRQVLFCLLTYLLQQQAELPWEAHTMGL